MALNARPITEIPAEFFDLDEPLSLNLPLLDHYLERVSDRKPLQGITLFLIQHQLSNQVPMVQALVDLGVEPSEIYWLDIPYTANKSVREFVQAEIKVPKENFSEANYTIFEPYALYQHGRTLEFLHRFIDRRPDKLLVLDDGAYFLKALTCFDVSHWPKRMSIVEQTTRGIIKMRHDASLRAACELVPLVNVATSAPKKVLEPPFIAMAICASLTSRLEFHFDDEFRGRALILGYGAIGEQVASYLSHHFGIERDQMYISDPDEEKLGLALRRGFSKWNPDDFATKFQLVIGCSGSASFKSSDFVYLESGAVLASASSGAVELSRRDYIELADVSGIDDIYILREEINETEIHTDIPIHFPNRRVNFLNAGFPVNFDGRATVCPTKYIQPTPTMMVAAALQAAEAAKPGLHELDLKFCAWVDKAFRQILGDKADWLLPPPDEAW